MTQLSYAVAASGQNKILEQSNFHIFTHKKRTGQIAMLTLI